MGNMLESCGVGRKIDEEGQEENIIPGTPANQTILGCAIPQATPETPINLSNTSSITAVCYS